MSNQPLPSIKIDFNRPEFRQLTLEEERALGRAVQEQGCMESRNRLVTSHMKLAMKIASKYSGRSRRDLQQEAFLGLNQAANKFDPEKGSRFSTYAIWWIKASIQGHIIKNHSMVKNGTTSDDKKLFFNFRRAENDLAHKQEDLTAFEVDAKLAEMLGVNIEKIQDTRMRLMADSSLDAPLSMDGDGGSWVDWLVDETAQAAEKNESKDQLDFARRAFANAVDKMLNDRERNILIRRRLKENPDTLEILAGEYDLSKERVRQIEERALEKVAQHISTACGIEIDLSLLKKKKRQDRESNIIRPKSLTKT